jgi:hypothetical protein
VEAETVDTVEAVDVLVPVVLVDETLEDVSVEVADVIVELVELVVSVNVEVVEDVVVAAFGLIDIDHVVASSVPSMSGTTVTK